MVKIIEAVAGAEIFVKLVREPQKNPPAPQHYRYLGDKKIS
jgi:hypothetical protein